jgi:DNA-directed RNA polymerase specialized sigma subunit
VKLANANPLTRPTAAPSADESAAEILERIEAQAGIRGLTKAERKAAQIEAARRFFDVRRSLWTALVRREPLALSLAMRARAEDASDYSNRKLIAEYRIAIADWLEAFAKSLRKKRDDGAQVGLFGAEEIITIPRLSAFDVPSLRAMILSDEAKAQRKAQRARKALARSVLQFWPNVDLLADRDGITTIATARASHHPEVKALVRAFDASLNRCVAINARLAFGVVERFHVGPSLSIDKSDLIAAALDGLWRACMDFMPGRGMFSTHAVGWIRQRVSRAIEDGRLIHTPSWVTDTLRAITAAGVDVRRSSGAIADVRSLALARADIMHTLGGLDMAIDQGERAVGKLEAGLTLAAATSDDDGYTMIDMHAVAAAKVKDLRALRRRLELRASEDRESARAAVRILLPAAEVSRLDDVVMMVLVSPTACGAVDAALEALLAAINEAHPAAKMTADKLTEALTHGQSLITSTTREGDDGEDEEIDLGSGDADAAMAEVQDAIDLMDLRDGLARLMESGDAGAEQAEVIRRLSGLEGAEEKLTDIAARPLRCTDRKVGRNEVARLRDEGIAALRSMMGGLDAREIDDDAGYAQVSL